MKQRQRYWDLAWKAWALIVLVLLLIPSNSLPTTDVPSIPFIDKIVHFILFGVLYYLVAKAANYPISSGKRYIDLFYVSLYSIFIEFAQLYFSRSFEIFDIIANVLGAITAYLFFNRKTNVRL